jgi:hypothetical protein
MTSADTTTDAFPIAWQEPEDAELTWEWDDMHMPTAVTPLAGDYNILMGSGFAYGYERLSVPYEVLTRIWNSYTYFAWRMQFPDPSTQPPRTATRRLAARRFPTSAAYWARAVSELSAITSLGSGRPMSGRRGRRGQGLGRGVATDRAGLEDHFYAIAAVPGDGRPGRPVQIDRARRPPGEALGLIGGTVHELHEVERGMERLADLATRRTGRAGRSAARRTLEEGVGVPGAEPFVDAMRAFSRRARPSRPDVATTLASRPGWRSREPPADQIGKRIGTRCPSTPRRGVGAWRTKPTRLPGSCASRW